MSTPRTHRAGIPVPTVDDLAPDEVVVAVFSDPDGKGHARFYGFWLDPDDPRVVRAQVFHRRLSGFVAHERDTGCVVTARDDHTAAVLEGLVDPLNLEIGVDRILHHHGSPPLLNDLELDLVVTAALDRGVPIERVAERLDVNRRTIERQRDRMVCAAA